MKPTSKTPSSRWPHRIAVVLAWMVFPLIWVGGLVTTTDAGMAVPDWPNTYNYNMFAYPIRDWFFGPWDLFVEHGHRLLASASGIVAIALCLATWRLDQRPYARGWATGILGLIIVQGVLGGQRVVLDQRSLALIHGCLGPAFFATVAVMVVITSRWWTDERRVVRDKRLSSTQALFTSSLSLLIVSYAQLVLGACLRHIKENADPNVYSTLLVAHLTTALAVVVLGILNLYFSERDNWRDSGVAIVSRGVVALVLLQCVLGCATYVVKFGWPSWLGQYGFAAHFVIAEKAFWQTNLITMHVATGSLILATAAYLFVRVVRAAGREEGPSVRRAKPVEPLPGLSRSVVEPS